PAACWLGGTATSSCTVLAPPGQASERCAPGASCIADLPWEYSATGACVSTCDESANPQNPASIPACDETCTALPLFGVGADSYGLCLTPGDGGCLGSLPTGQTELQGCYSNATCACPEVCVLFSDAGSSGAGIPNGACELPCATSADCPNPTTRCDPDAGLCAHASCTGLTCAFGDGGGTCLPPSFSWFGEQPFCVLAGTLTAGEVCAFPAPQTAFEPANGNAGGPMTLPGVPTLPPDELCAPGLLCVTEADGGASCAPACTPDGGSCGDGGLICYPVDPTGYGFCGACGAESSGCALDAQCCSGSCAPSGLCN
ncbi:MAG TPA: hypothetical protein VMB50_09000, partial [Myxococcales bacterium]|nr:hypothetical protein [Myxococcales bacterium]